jgi:hypothetical protein
MELAALIKAPDLMVNNYLKLAFLDSAKGNFNAAMRDMYQYSVLKDSVYNLNKSEQVAKLQAIYDAETKDKENQQLRAEKNFRDSQLKLQNQIIYAIGFGFFLTIIMAILLARQRRKIMSVNKILQE